MDDCHTLAQSFPRPTRLKILTTELQFAFIWTNLAADDFQERTFTRPIFSNNCQTFTAIDIQIQA